ncbi:TRAP transporter large permease [Oceanicella sp. SM1341]|uniref:TRAP transporter large permease n=1 Tax=Oceanicella sp. SM1341 TaxID=1548889 RepID=UPI000E48B0D0|nr:TRAP transporter large permease [Oceanicella sp. SM1341]
MLETLYGFLVVFGLLMLGAPIAFGMALVGFGGFALIVGVNPSLAMLGQIAYETTMSDSLSVVPLFILMGNLITRAGLSRALFDFANAFLGHHRGGLAMATVVACGGFAAVSGSSMATSATMSKVAIPSMRRFNYADSLAAGSIAAGGTLGILIPPSVILVLYGTLTSTDIGTLFVAGVLPGIVGMLFYIGAVQVATRLNPESGPRGARAGWPERLTAFSRIWGVAVLFALVMGGIYFGIFTPTEAAGIGAGGAFLFALLRGGLTLRKLYEVLVETAITSTMMFVLLIGAILFSNFINVAGLPRELSALIAGTEAPPLVILVIILAIYIALGCVLESLSMMLLTVPIFFPIIQQLGFDPVWFGIIVVIVIEISLITPPIGMNAFVLRATLPDIPIQTIFRGLAPFILADILRLALLVLVPWVTLFLPSLM